MEIEGRYPTTNMFTINHLNVDPSLPTSTSRSPGVIHMISVPRPFPAFHHSSTSVYYTEHKLKNKKSVGGVGTRLYALLQVHEKEMLSWSSNHLSLVVHRLICDPKVRLGKNGIEDFKRHPFFHDMDWENIRNTKPPFIPEYSSPTDTRNFEPIEEEEAVPRRYHVRSSFYCQSVCLSLASDPGPFS